MKKIIGYLIIAILMLSIAYGVYSKKDSKKSIQVGLVFDMAGRGDQSFNDSAYLGLIKARDELGVTIEMATPKSPKDLPNLFADFSLKKKDIIIGVGFSMTKALTESAVKNPSIKFGLIDSFTKPENVSSLVFAEHEGSFLVGVAAALKTKTNRIGFIGGVKFPLIQKFEAGFVAGAKAVNPKINVDVKYITAFPDFSGFFSPDKAKAIALKQYREGVDIIFHASGGSGIGMFQAAKEFSTSKGSKVWGIGVDADQYRSVGKDLQNYVLTSMLKRIDTAIYLTTKSVDDGNFVGGPTMFNLKNNGVDYSTSGGFIDDIKSEINKYKGKVISGKIVVPVKP